MILSVSRRTDIPAFYSKWFYNRIKEGFVMVRNPLNYHQVSKINLSPDVIDCIVFWSKNPQPLFKYLDKINEKYNFYFQYTINAYEKDIEPNILDLDSRIDNFIYLSKKYGKEKVIWRYDPILLSNKYSIEWHLEKFAYITNKLKNYTNACVFSFVDIYSKNKINLIKNGVQDIDVNTVEIISSKMVDILKDSNIELRSCCEDYDLTKIGVKKSCCIDPILISKIIGNKIIAHKDNNQRSSCGCIESVDIGQYNTCKHLCLYCYANYKEDVVKNTIICHDDESPLLVGNIEEKDNIHIRDVKSLKDTQISMFDLFK